MTVGIAASADGRARDQIGLGSLIMVPPVPRLWTGQVPLRSRRATDDLHELRRLAEPHTHLPEIADLSQRIGTLVTAV